MTAVTAKVFVAHLSGLCLCEDGEPRRGIPCPLKSKTKAFVRDGRRVPDSSLKLVKQTFKATTWLAA